MKIGQRTKTRIPSRSSARSGAPVQAPAAATDRRILDHAREAFNERGVTAVGIREIARDLGLSPGNVSYHFATKEALIAAMVREGHAENTAALQPPPRLRDFSELHGILLVVMRRDLDNRWLQRDYTSLLATMPSFRELHDQLQGPREARIDRVVAELTDAGLLDADRVQPRSADLRRQLFTQVFFWLPAAMVTAPDADPARSLGASARAVMALFLPYCTEPGRKQLDDVLSGRKSA